MRVIECESAEYDVLSGRISDGLCFDSSREDWLALPNVYKKYRLNSCWEEDCERLVRDTLIKAGLRDMYAADIHHDYFEFDVRENIPYGYCFEDEERNCNVFFPSFYPDGDYHFFFDKDMTAGIFGHPWRKELYVMGEELIRLFDLYSSELGLAEIKE